MRLKPLGKGLLGTTLRYDYEVRNEKDYFKEIPQPRIAKDMVKLAEHILDSKAGRFNPDKFKDQYENALKKLVRRNKGQVLAVSPDPTTTRMAYDHVRNQFYMDAATLKAIGDAVKPNLNDAFLRVFNQTPPITASIEVFAELILQSSLGTAPNVTIINTVQRVQGPVTIVFGRKQ